MLIAGMVRCSFIDYPGRPAAVLFLHGCNLRCPYCHNPDLVTGMPSRWLELTTVMDFLATRRGQLGGVVVTGGEPTLHRDLNVLLGAIRALEFPIKLDTNGSRPQVLRSLLANGLLDYIAMDLKDEPDDPCPSTGRVIPAHHVRASIACIRDSGLDHEFRTTVHTPRHDRARLLRMASELHGGRRWWLQRYRPARTLDPTFTGQSPDPALLTAVAAAVSAEGLPTAWR